MEIDDAELVKPVLKSLSKRFSDHDVDIDIKIYNASPICKMYGTLARKGEHTPERPHRVSSIIAIPDQLDVVPLQLARLSGVVRSRSFESL